MSFVFVLKAVLKISQTYCNFLFMVLGIEPEALHMLGKRCTSELRPRQDSSHAYGCFPDKQCLHSWFLSGQFHVGFILCVLHMVA